MKEQLLMNPFASAIIRAPTNGLQISRNLQFSKYISNFSFRPTNEKGGIPFGKSKHSNLIKLLIINKKKLIILLRKIKRINGNPVFKTIKMKKVYH